jgi:hypothetical protein
VTACCSFGEVSLLGSAVAGAASATDAAQAAAVRARSALRGVAGKDVPFGANDHGLPRER